MYRLNIIYEDKSILVVNKEAGLLTVATSKELEKTLYHYVYEYLHKKNQKVFVVHRLDRDTSGLVLFAKTEDVKHTLQNNWEDCKRQYYAVCIGHAKDHDILKSYLAENKSLITYTTDSKHGKIAITEYKTIKHNDLYSLIDIDLKTGRKNQIRVQLNEAGLPILGDSKYGNNKYKKMCLHAYKLVIKHPKTKNEMTFETKKPSYFAL